MPWTLDIMGLITVFVVALVAGAGWTLGSWIISRITSAFSRPHQ